mgnify:CR=1 FL=1
MTYNNYATIYQCNHKNACQALFYQGVTIGEIMTTNDIAVLEQSLTQASPSEAGKIWTNVAGNRTLAISVHNLLTHQQRIDLAEKLTRAEEGQKIKGNDINHLV